MPYVILNTPGDGNWTVPVDWNNANNHVECIGGGSSGSCRGFSTPRSGGGGGYSKTVNMVLVPGTIIPFHVANPAIANGPPNSDVQVSGEDSTFGALHRGDPGILCSAWGGFAWIGGGIGVHTAPFGYSGGQGFNNFFSTSSPQYGGGGAAGPNGTGGACPSSPPDGSGGQGGNGFGGLGGIPNVDFSSNPGGNGSDILPGIGSGGGGSSSTGNPALPGGDGGRYGGGGGIGPDGGLSRGGNGGQGLIVIYWQTNPPRRYSAGLRRRG